MSSGPFEVLASIVGMFLIFGPFGAWLACKKTSEHINDPPDIFGGTLVVLHPVLLGVWVALHMLLKQTFPEWLAGVSGSIILIAFEFLLWRRAIKHTNCALRVASVFKALNR